MTQRLNNSSCAGEGVAAAPTRRKGRTFAAVGRDLCLVLGCSSRAMA